MPLVLLLAVTGSVLAAEVASDRQVLILVRALAYDGNLKARAGEELVIGVLAKPGHAASEQVAEGIHRAFHGLGAVKVQGLPIKAVKLTYTNATALAAAIRSESLDAVYVCPGLDGELGAITGVTRGQRVLSMASAEELIAKGAAVGVFMVDGKPTIFVNLPASRLEGADFGSDLLRLAKVVK
jgi:hypothetical protein